MTTLYSCKTETHPDGDCCRITKFDANLNVESSYQIATDGSWCTCPAGERPTCRHREMLPRFWERDAVNTFWMHDFDRNGWVSMGTEPATAEEFPDAAREDWERHNAELEHPLAGQQSLGDALRAANIPGVTVVDLGDPRTLYDTIAEAVGEPKSTPRVNRRGF